MSSQFFVNNPKQAKNQSYLMSHDLSAMDCQIHPQVVL